MDHNGKSGIILSFLKSRGIAGATTKECDDIAATNRSAMYVRRLRTGTTLDGTSYEIETIRERGSDRNGISCVFARYIFKGVASGAEMASR